jgi:hypothetical protein
MYSRTHDVGDLLLRLRARATSRASTHENALESESRTNVRSMLRSVLALSHQPSRKMSSHAAMATAPFTNAVVNSMRRL